MTRSDPNPAKVLAEIKDGPAPKPCADCLRVNALLGLSHAREEELKIELSNAREIDLAADLAIGMWKTRTAKAETDLAIAKASISMLQQMVRELNERKDPHGEGHPDDPTSTT